MVDCDNDNKEDDSFCVGDDDDIDGFGEEDDRDNEGEGWELANSLARAVTGKSRL